MLQIKTYLDKSSIHGIGLFADEDIEKGTIIWEYYKGIDVEVQQFALNSIEWHFIEKYAYYDRQLDIWILPADNDRSTNHSEDPNTGPLEDGKMVVLKNIKSGEEITCNYHEIDYEVNLKLK